MSLISMNLEAAGGLLTLSERDLRLINTYFRFIVCKRP